MVPGRPWTRRFASVATRCTGPLRRPVTRRLLVTAGIAAAGWLLGAAAQAHADTVPGARLSHVVTPTGRSTATAPGHGAAAAVPHHRAPMAAPGRRAPVAISGIGAPAGRVMPAVPDPGAVLHRVRPPVVPASPRPAATVTAASRQTGDPVRPADPSRTSRHRRPGPRAGSGVGTVPRTGPRAVTGASEKASAVRAVRSAVTTPFPPRAPRPPSFQARALPPVTGGGAGPVVSPHAGRSSRPRQGSPGPAFPTGSLAPAVRTAADEPSFSPD